MLKAKTAVITGGSRGIGAAIARKLASMGADVALVYCASADAAAEVLADCRGYGVRASAYQCNVADYAEVKALAAAIRRDFGRADILVNNAGITRDGLVAAMSEEAFTSVLDTNLTGAFHMIRHFSPLMLRQRSGKIINISSIAGLMGNAGQANYAASKAGLIGLTKSVARELASRGICCNAIAPGLIETNMTKELAESPLSAAVPLGRMGQPEEVAALAAFLAESDYITGEVIRIDGGLAM